MRKLLITVSAIAGLTAAAFSAEQVTLNEFPEGSISQKEGLENWQLFYEVASHPRCSNCHAGADGRPMWSGPSFGKARPHGMNIQAGESRIGAETIPCSTCHTTLSAANPDANTVPHAAPRVAADWHMAPVEAEWFRKPSSEVCQQLRNPQQNGNRTIAEIAKHLGHDVILHWAWNPGGGREPAPHSLQASMDALMKWAAAGTPCPQG